MSGRAAPALRAAPTGAWLLLAGLAAWIAVALGAANIDAAAPATFAAAWTLMMAAMMLPSLVPAGRAVAEVAAQRRERWAGAGLVPFAIGYLFVWGLVGLAAAGVLEAGRAAGIAVDGRV